MLFQETSAVFKVNTTKKLSASDEVAITEMVLDHPSLYLHELQNALYQSTGTDVSTSTICRFLHHEGFTYKKLTFRA